MLIRLSDKVTAVFSALAALLVVMHIATTWRSSGWFELLRQFCLLAFIWRIWVFQEKAAQTIAQSVPDTSMVGELLRKTSNTVILALLAIVWALGLFPR
jgi:hypothetical protein